MGADADDFTIELEVVPGVEPMPEAKLRAALWKWIDKFAGTHRLRGKIDPDVWKMYADNFRVELAAETPASLACFFTRNYVFAHSAHLAVHWAAHALVAQRAEVDASLGGWRLAAVPIDHAPPTFVELERWEWCCVGRLDAHARLAEIEAPFTGDNEPVLPDLATLSEAERAIVEWVAMTRLCQCPACAGMSGYLAPADHVDTARWTWEMLETDARARELEANALRSADAIDVLADHIETLGARPPRAALAGMLRDRPGLREPRGVPRPRHIVVARSGKPKAAPAVPRGGRPLALGSVAGIDPRFAGVYAEPWNDGPRLALADALAGEDPARSELIRLQLAPRPTKDQVARGKQLIKEHGRRWLPAGIGPTGVRWERGFPVAAAPKTLAAATLAWATLREIDLGKVGARDVPDVHAPAFGGVESWFDMPLLADPPPSRGESRVERLCLAIPHHDDVEQVYRHAAMFPALADFAVSHGEFPSCDDGSLAWCRALVARLAACDALERVVLFGALHYERDGAGFALASIAIPHPLGQQLTGAKPATAESDRWLALARAFDGPIAAYGFAVDGLAGPLERRPDQLATFAKFVVSAPMFP